MSSSNCCFLTCIQVSQEAGQVVWYAHLFQNFPQFLVIHTVKGFGIVNKAEIDVFSGTLLLFWWSSRCWQFDLWFLCQIRGVHFYSEFPAWVGVYSVVFDFLRPHGLQPFRFLCPWDSPGKNTGVSCHFLLQGIFLKQGSNLGVLYCRRILYRLSQNLGSLKSCYDTTWCNCCLSEVFLQDSF